MNKQLTVIPESYRIVTVTVSTTKTSIRKLLTAASAVLAAGEIVKVTLNPASAVLLEDGYNASQLTISSAYTVAAMDIETALLSCASSTVSVKIEVYQQDSVVRMA